MGGLNNKPKSAKETVMNRKTDMQKLFKCHAKKQIWKHERKVKRHGDTVRSNIYSI